MVQLGLIGFFVIIFHFFFFSLLFPLFCGSWICPSICCVSLDSVHSNSAYPYDHPIDIGPVYYRIFWPYNLWSHRAAARPGPSCAIDKVWYGLLRWLALAGLSPISVGTVAFYEDNLKFLQPNLTILLHNSSPHHIIPSATETRK